MRRNLAAAAALGTAESQGERSLETTKAPRVGVLIRRSRDLPWA